MRLVGTGRQDMAVEVGGARRLFRGKSITRMGEVGSSTDLTGSS